MKLKKFEVEEIWSWRNLKLKKSEVEEIWRHLYLKKILLEKNLKLKKFVVQDTWSWRHSKLNMLLKFKDKNGSWYLKLEKNKIKTALTRFWLTWNLLTRVGGWVGWNLTIKTISTQLIWLKSSASWRDLKLKKFKTEEIWSWKNLKLEVEEIWMWRNFKLGWVGGWDKNLH